MTTGIGGLEEVVPLHELEQTAAIQTGAASSLMKSALLNTGCGFLLTLFSLGLNVPPAFKFVLATSAVGVSGLAVSQKGRHDAQSFKAEIAVTRYAAAAHGSIKRMEEAADELHKAKLDAQLSPQAMGAPPMTEEQLILLEIQKVLSEHGNVKVYLGEIEYTETGWRSPIKPGKGVKISQVESAVKGCSNELKVFAAIPECRVVQDVGALWFDVTTKQVEALPASASHSAAIKTVVEVPDGEEWADDDIVVPTPIVRPVVPATVSVLAKQSVITPSDVAASKVRSDVDTFKAFLSQPHNWVAGKTGGGKTFLLLRLLRDKLASIPEGTDYEVYILDRNFGKPDPETGELFDWAGFPHEFIYDRDEAILAVLSRKYSDMIELKERCADYLRNPKGERPAIKPVLILVTEWNALADATKTSKDVYSSDAVTYMRPILQQGRGYGYKVILDGQSIAVGESGISEALREQMSICLVGETACRADMVAHMGGSKEQQKQVLATATQLRQSGRRACVIQVGDGAPIASIVPEMPELREFRFDAATIPSPDPFEQFDDAFEDKFGVDPDDVLEVDVNSIPQGLKEVL